MGGHLTITGPGVSVRLSGDAGGPATLVVEGVVPAVRGVARALAGRAGATGLEITVRDGRGRELVRVGPGLRSPLGRLLLGTARTRPTMRGLLAARRGVTRSAAPESHDHGGGVS